MDTEMVTWQKFGALLDAVQELKVKEKQYEDENSFILPPWHDSQLHLRKLSISDTMELMKDVKFTGNQTKFYVLLDMIDLEHDELEREENARMQVLMSFKGDWEKFGTLVDFTKSESEERESNETERNRVSSSTTTSSGNDTKKKGNTDHNHDHADDKSSKGTLPKEFQEFEGLA